MGDPSSVTTWEVRQGDSRELLRDVETGSIDIVATDPPYALVSGHLRDDRKATGGFMGKAWDASLPDPAIWLANLHTAGVTHVFVQLREERDNVLGADLPYELGWMDARRHLFHLLLSGDCFRIYQVLPPSEEPCSP